MSYSIADPERRVMNLHDFILSIDAKRDGFLLYAAGRSWKLQANTECEAWLLIEQESGGVLHEDVWAALPSSGWSVVDATSQA
jgi:hypothetical protein